MTFPTFEGDISEIMMAEMLQEASTPVRMHFPQQLPSVAQMIFTSIKSPHIHSRLKLPMEKIHRSPLVARMMYVFKPSTFVEGAILSQQNVHAAKVEKPVTVSPPKESSNQRDEAAAKTQGKDLVSIEVFKGEKNQENQQNSSGQQGGKSDGNQKGSPPMQSKEGLEERKMSFDRGKTSKGDEPLPQPEKATSETNSQMNKEMPAVSFSRDQKSAKSHSETSFLQSPASTTGKSNENKEALQPPSQSQSTSELKQKSTENKQVHHEKGDLPALSNPDTSPLLVPLVPRAQPPSKEISVPDKEQQKVSDLKEQASTKQGQFSFNQNNQNSQSSTQKREAAEAPRVLPSKEPSSNGKEGMPKTGSERMVSRTENKETTPKSIQDSEKFPEKKEHVSKSPELKKESLPLEQRLDRPKLEEIIKHQNENLFSNPTVVNPERSGKLAEEFVAQSVQLKIFQLQDRNVNMQIPPWLTMLLPDLTKSESLGRKGGGDKQGAVLQNPHKLSDMLFILLCAHVVGAKSLVEVFRFIEAREKWFTVVLGLKHGLPPRQLFFWLLATIDASQFDHTVHRWLREIQGRQEEQPMLFDIVLTQTALGFIIGQQKHPDAKRDLRVPTELVKGFQLENCALMARSENSYGALLSKIVQRGGKYLAEIDDELVPPDEHERFESYIEGVERIIVLEWNSEGSPETHLKVVNEVYGPGGVVETERFYVSSFDNPADYYFDLFRMQKPYESKLIWLLNIALSFPSVDVSIQRCSASLSAFQRFAEELIMQESPSQPIEKTMQKAAQDSTYLLKLISHM